MNSTTEYEEQLSMSLLTSIQCLPVVRVNMRMLVSGLRKRGLLSLLIRERFLQNIIKISIGRSRQWTTNSLLDGFCLPFSVSSLISLSLPAPSLLSLSLSPSLVLSLSVSLSFARSFSQSLVHSVTRSFDHSPSFARSRSPSHSQSIIDN